MTPLSEINTLRARSNAKPLSDLSIDSFLMKGSLSLPLKVTLYMITKDLIKMLETFNLMIQILLPIPQSEMDSNSEMVQNPGY